VSWRGRDISEDLPSTSDGRLPGRERDYHFWPTQVLDQLIVLFLTLSVLVGLAVLFPIRALGPADPLHQPVAIKPQWYFLPLHQLTRYLPAWMVAGLFVVGGVVLLVWPLLEAEAARRLGPLAGRALGVLVLAGILLLGGLGLLSDRTWVVLGHSVHVDSYGLPHSVPAADSAAATAGVLRAPPPTPPPAMNPPAAPTAQAAPPTAYSFTPPPATPHEIGQPLTGQAQPLTPPAQALTPPAQGSPLGPPDAAALPLPPPARPDQP
jgi:hypothetical protein